jgi:CheY-like chemotaxis protein
MNHVPVAHSPFFFIERLVRILVVDKKPEAGEIVKCLNNYKPYCVTLLPNATDALMLLSKSWNFHICLCDLDNLDVDDTDFSLLKKLSSHSSLIIMTNRDSFEQGFKIANLGAFGVIKKPIDFLQQPVFNLLNDAFLHRIILKGTNKNTKPVILDAIKVFIENKPVRVKEWVEKIGVEERYLRRVWVDYFGFQPRYLVSLHRLLHDALNHFNYLHFQKNSSGAHFSRSFDCYSDDDFTYRNNRFNALYEKHKFILEAIVDR